MKHFLALFFAFCLLISLLTACGGSPAPEPDLAPEPEAPPEAPSSVSPAPQESASPAGEADASDPRDAEKKPFVIQNVYDDYYVSDSPDPAPTELLCQYFRERLSPDEYLMIEPWEEYIPRAPWEEDDPEVSESNYFVLLYGPDIGLFENLLNSYDGPWAPIVFGETSYSLRDLMKAESDIKIFLEGHPEIIYAEIRRMTDVIYISGVEEGYEELKRFADDYPIPELFLIEKAEEKVIDETQIREYS